jgi:flagella synthesis protein FlgN
MSIDAGFAQRLAHLIQEELVLLERFVDLLKREEALLVANQTDSLLALAAEKTAQYRSLQRISDERVTHFARARLALTPANIAAALAGQPLSLSTWQAVIKLARDAHARNKLNGQLITERLSNNQQALSTLLMAAEQPQIYGPDGHSRLGASSRHLGSC